MEPTPSAWDIRGPIPSVTDRYYTKYYATGQQRAVRHVLVKNVFSQI
jgi:hypothetical protein